MSSINRLPQGTASLAAQVPFYDPQNGADRRVSFQEMAALLSTLSPEEQAALQSLLFGTFTGGTYDGEGRLVSYYRNGILHTVDYTDPLNPVISNSQGQIRSVSLDGDGRVVAVV